MRRKYRVGALVALGFLGTGCTGLTVNLPNNPAPSQAQSITVLPITAALVSQQNADTGATLKPRLPIPVASQFHSDPHEYRYPVGPGDKLTIVVPTLASLSTEQAPAVAVGSVSDSANTYVVAEDGTVYVPLAGHLSVQGKTTREIQELVNSQLSRFIKSPQVLVSVREFNSQRVIVTGAVAKPGYLPITNVPLTVLDAVVAAGAIAPSSAALNYPTALTGTSQSQQGARADQPDLRKVQLRRGNDTTVVDVEHMLASGDRSGNYFLRDGDAIQVGRQARTHVYLLGEIREHGMVEIQDRHTSLAQVMAAAGGIREYTANAERIYVIRGSPEQPTIFQLNAEQPEALLLADAFTMQGRDVVYVAEEGILQWNRFLTNLFPSIQSLITAGVFINATQ